MTEMEENAVNHVTLEIGQSVDGQEEEEEEYDEILTPLFSPTGGMSLHCA